MQEFTWLEDAEEVIQLRPWQYREGGEFERRGLEQMQHLVLLQKGHSV